MHQFDHGFSFAAGFLAYFNQDEGNSPYETTLRDGIDKLPFTSEYAGMFWLLQRETFYSIPKSFNISFEHCNHSK